MNSTPHFVLFSRTGKQTSDHGLHGGSWYFRLESTDGLTRLEASDTESDSSRERLELLAVIRGLEALDQPSRVTLVTTSRQVSRAIRQGLEYWRIRDWKWERFGEKVPMKNADLWKRVDCALQIHDVRCRTLRFDSAHEQLAGEIPATSRNRIGSQDAAARIASRGSVNQAAEGKTQRAPRFLFKPIIWGTRRTADAMLATATALQRCLPETASPYAT